MFNKQRICTGDFLENGTDNQCVDVFADFEWHSILKA
jgi:hypothetical protein